MIAQWGLGQKLNGKKGYVTAGHCVNGVNTAIPSGTVKMRQYANNQKYDYAFVETKSSYVPSNKLNQPRNGNITLAAQKFCPITVVNMPIAKVGHKTGYTSGKVTHLNTTAY